MATYGYTGRFKHANGQWYFAEGEIDGSTVKATLSKYEPHPTSGGGLIGKQLWKGTLNLAGTINSSRLGELLRQRLALQLGCPIKKVSVGKIRLTLKYVREGEIGTTVVYNYMCELQRQGAQPLVVFGQVVMDEVTVRLSKYSSPPRRLGEGGIMGDDLMAATLVLDPSIDRRYWEAFKAHVQDLVHRRVAAYLRCAPRVLMVRRFSMGADQTATNARISAEKKSSRTARTR